MEVKAIEVHQPVIVGGIDDQFVDDAKIGPLQKLMLQTERFGTDWAPTVLRCLHSENTRM